MKLYEKIYLIMFFIFILFLNLQSLSIHGWIDENDLSSNVKIYHIVSVLFLPFIAIHIKYKIKKRSLPILCFAFIVILVSLWSLTKYPFNNMLFNYIFAFYCFYIGFMTSNIISYDTSKKTFSLLAALMLLFVIIKDFCFLDKIVNFLKAPFGHPVMLWFYGGGANLEATWITMMSAFVMRYNFFFLYILLSFLICVLYSSRTAFALAILAIVIKYLSSDTSVKQRKAILLGSIFLFFVTISAIIYFNVDIFLVERFISIGDDPGSLGRLELWEHIVDAFMSNPLGYGAGNAVKVLSDISGTVFENDNVHNYYAQVLLDFGFIGLVAYLVIILSIIRRQMLLFNDMFAVFLIFYFAGSVLQFRGAETFIWLLIGLYTHNYLSIKNNTSYANV